MSLLPLPKPRARSLLAALPDVGHSLRCPPPQCLTPTNEWSWCCSGGRRPWPCWAWGSTVKGAGGPSELGVLCMSPHPRTCHFMGGGSANSSHQVPSRPQAGPQQVGVAAVAGR